MVYIITMKKRKTITENDSAWKDVVEYMFEPFLEMLFPHIFRAIDFSKKYEFLNNELRKISPHNKTGKRFTDVLAKVYLNDSDKPVILLIHMEIQGYKDPDFMKRMFIYNYRICDRMSEEGLEVISLGVLTDDDPDFRPDEYVHSRLGFEKRMKIPIAKILDYDRIEAKKNSLAITGNPMAVVIKTQLKSFEVTQADDKQKYNFKRELIIACYKEGYSKNYIRALFNFIDYIIRLPEYLEKKISDEVTAIEEAGKMNYVTSWERIAKKEGKKEGKLEGIKLGMEKGMEKGVEKGIKEGKKEGKMEIALGMIKKGLSFDLIAEITGFPKERIEKLAASGL